MIAIWILRRPDSADALDDPLVISALPRYVGAVKNRRLVRFLVSRLIGSEFTEDSAEGELWEEHRRGLSKASDLAKRLDSGEVSLKDLRAPAKSLLGLKALLGRRMMESCVLCERMCRKNRLKGELGYCGEGTDMRVSSCFQHMGEEPEIVPSFTVCGLLRPAELAWAAISGASTVRIGG